MNITDVDDKILQTAAAQNMDPVRLARSYEAEFWNDWDALHCWRPHVVTRVTEHVTSHIVPFIARLYEQGMAYVIPDDGVYFDTQAFEDANPTLTRYGKLAPPAQATAFWDSSSSSTSHNSNADTLPATSKSKKKNVRDFVLWKMHKEGESMVWDAPWGRGRPGWHIECSAMIQAVQERFGQTHQFVLHTGGIDLKFPHHTNEIAQSEAYHYGSNQNDAAVDDDNNSKREWIPHWVHFGHLHIDGRKMSKSLKNFITVQEVLQQKEENTSSSDASASSLASPADDFRLWCLSHASYRSPVTYSAERLEHAQQMRGRIVRFFLAAEEWISATDDNMVHSNTTKVWNGRDMQLFRAAQSLSTAHVETLFDDLDGASWLKIVLTLVDDGTDYINTTKPGKGPVEVLRTAVETLRRALALVGFSNVTVDAGKSSVQHTSSQIVGGEGALLDTFVEFREKVRRIALASVQGKHSSDSANTEILELCDSLRDETLPSLGVELMDGKVAGMGDNGGASCKGTGWQYCIPRQPSPREPSEKVSSGSQTSTTTIRLEDLQQIPLSDFFRSGQFEGEFSAYDDEGIPTHNADGSEVSKRQRKKLLKKRSVHEKRLQNIESAKRRLWNWILIRSLERDTLIFVQFGKEAQK